ncbi:putative ribonuclease E/G family protein [Rhizobium phage RHph_TM3_3_9]|nr:putative ribonuclease E/G family protein [Rhizobium phage RHph_TM3_3_9]QIG67809.1 putative ribonuclease E/G family protein [Rhizobium phage RHph_Y60]QIG68528.1 putative ribonuclease E/G family protein [Rhizobium phage RHph_TM3_3_13]QIG74386.1 putative ribonuclease E/G family protein [Rhizobium phage RHph_TM3_3_10]QXV74499.1 putative ribonuclease E/G family protein [Rhizobium phage RHEph19]
MSTRKFTVTFDVTDEEFSNFMTRCSGNAVLSNEIPRNTTVTVDGDSDEGPVNTNAPAVDSAGVPYDARYHAKTKNFKEDGTWKRAKGLSDALKAEADAFEANAKAAFAAASAAPVVAASTAPVAELTTYPVAETPAPAAPVVGLPTGAPAVVTGMPGLPMPTAPVAPPPVTYEEVVAKYQAVAQTHAAHVADWQALYASCGITDPNSLTTDETLRRKLFDKLDEISKIAA